MYFNELYKKYDNHSVDIQELMDEIEKWKCPYLVVEEKEVPEDLKRLNNFDKKDVRPLTGGEKSRIRENVVEYFVYDSATEQIYEDEFLPLIKKRFVGYERDDFGPGMTKITFVIGEKKRKENDRRFFDKVNVEKDESIFLYDYESNHYKQINPTKQEWLQRIEKFEELKLKAIPYIRFYHELKKMIWKKRRADWDKNRYIFEFAAPINKIDSKTFLNIMYDFFKETKKYLFIINFTGYIDNEEYDRLIEVIEKQIEFFNTCYEYTVLSEENMLYEFSDILNLPKRDPFIDTKIRLEKLLTPREEKLEYIDITNFHTGFVYIDINRDKLFPNLGEIQRRLDQSLTPLNADVEKEIDNAIINFAKQKRKDN